MIQTYDETPVGAIPLPGEPVIPGDAILQAQEDLMHMVRFEAGLDPFYEELLEEIRQVVYEIYARGADPWTVTLYEDRSMPDLIMQRVSQYEIPPEVKRNIDYLRVAEDYKRTSIEVRFGDRLYWARTQRIT